MKTWQQYGNEIERGPGPAVMKIGVFVLTVIVTLGALSWVGGWFTDAAKVAKQEFSASALLKKYEWFKDAAAQLDKKRADIRVYEHRLTILDRTPRDQWDRTDKELYGQWLSEVAGVKASYNALAADYNAQMAKFNWRFTNAGMLPEGASEPLPREFKPYTEN